MAKIKGNILTQGLTGTIGNLVFRKHGDKTTVYVLSPRKTPLTDKQKEANGHFAEAVALASRALKDDTERKKFEKLARKNKKASAYSAAVSYYLKQGD